MTELHKNYTPIYNQYVCNIPRIILLQKIGTLCSYHNVKEKTSLNHRVTGLLKLPLHMKTTVSS